MVTIVLLAFGLWMSTPYDRDFALNYRQAADGPWGRMPTEPPMPRRGRKSSSNRAPMPKPKEKLNPRSLGRKTAAGKRA
jgi:hypothetical protein